MRNLLLAALVLIGGMVGVGAAKAPSPFAEFTSQDNHYVLWYLKKLTITHDAPLIAKATEELHLTLPPDHRLPAPDVAWFGADPSRSHQYVPFLTLQVKPVPRLQKVQKRGRRFANGLTHWMETDLTGSKVRHHPSPVDIGGENFFYASLDVQEVRVRLYTAVYEGKAYVFTLADHADGMTQRLPTYEKTVFSMRFTE